MSALTHAFRLCWRLPLQRPLCTGGWRQWSPSCQWRCAYPALVQAVPPADQILSDAGQVLQRNHVVLDSLWTDEELGILPDDED
ncbi:hypothetical protein HPG69_008544 [Diceros bicornis minor]|uniref:Uncharacterized protein n=1 Tax=Diceros bicornis minor TaxID=77932 RepID=A0A7J7F9W6_DICBM|nr:hypothetical protein HPG69_008544 [Diceros bicornis minor]